MAVKFGLWRIDGESVKPVAPSVIASEERLEEVLEARIDILGLGDLMQIGRQVITEYGKRIDLLAMDAQGDLYVIELKKDRTPREVVAQALEYGFWVQGLSFEDLRKLYGKHHDDEDFDSAFTERFSAEPPEAVNTAHQLIVVAAGMDTSTEQIVEYIRGYEVPINVLFFEYLDDDGREYLARSWLADPELETPTKGGGSKKRAPWNGLDFYVAVGENDERNWDDMVTYGFVSAGHGEKYRRAMETLFVGARIWASIPSSRAAGGANGYVGVGTVAATAVGVRHFDVVVDGRTVNILDAPLKAPNMAWDADDPELCEYLVRVEWIEYRAREDALWEKGMFANQNVVTKLRQPFTLQKLGEAFDVD